MLPSNIVDLMKLWLKFGASREKFNGFFTSNTQSWVCVLDLCKENTFIMPMQK